MQIGDIVTIRPEYLEAGESARRYVLVSLTGTHAQIKALDTGLTFAPVETVAPRMVQHWSKA